MYKLLLISLLFLVMHVGLKAQIRPIEGSRLNYRIVGFKVPLVAHASKYKIEIASGKYYSEDSFKNNIILKRAMDKNKIIAEVPAFGASYSWRFSYEVNGIISHTPIYHFTTTYVHDVDTTITRFRIMQPATKYSDDYVFLDRSRALYDMNGRPVWYLPKLTEISDIMDNWVSDLKITSQNTITYIIRPAGRANTSNFQAYEVDYEGNTLWKGPDDGKVSGDSLEHYHHEFTRLSNGHYMVLGSEFNWRFPSPKDSAFFRDTVSKIKEFNGIEFGTVIEYDEKGNVVWCWKSSKYFLEEDPTFIKPIKRYYLGGLVHAPFVNNTIRPDIQDLQKDVHENAFFFDEKNQVLYVSFKNVSKIIKLKYPEGTVLNTFGPVQRKNGDENGKGLFCHQHGCRISKEGYLYMFNNNLCDTTPAKVVMFQEPADGSNALKKMWEYQCTVEDGYPRQFLSGGNALELPGGEMFISMGGNYSKVLIVSMDKKILWSALPERWNSRKKKWENIHESRSSIISREQLEDLIWNSEKEE